MIILSIEDNSRSVRNALHRLQQGMKNQRPVMDSIGQELVSRVSGRFETETDPLGQSWEPWAPFTKETYPKDGNGRILDRYGDMLASLNHSADSNSARVGFGKAEAVFHEWGTWKMPRRGMLFADPDAGELSPDDDAAVLDIIGVWLDGLAT